MAASGMARGGQEKRHVFIFSPVSETDPAKAAVRSRPAGDLRLTPRSLSHVTCHSFQFSNQPAPSSSLRNSLQRAGPEPYTVLETDFSTNSLRRKMQLVAYTGGLETKQSRFLALGPSVFPDLGETRVAQVIIAKSQEPRAGIHSRMR